MRYFIVLTIAMLTACGGGSDARSPLNQPPSIDAPDSVVITANETSAIEVQVSDDLTAVGVLQLTFSSGESTLLPVDQLNISGDGERRTLNITPLADEFGVTTVTITARDAQGLEASREMTIDVMPQRLPLENFVREQFLRDAGDAPALVNAVVFDNDVLENELDDLL